MTFKISIILPNKTFFQKDINEVILPTLNGQMGVLTNHISALTGLDAGLILIRDDSSPRWTPIVITGGLALINDNNVDILATEAEFGSDINTQEAKENYLAAKTALEKAALGINPDEISIFELNAQFKKARARFEYVEWLEKNG